jgi:putative SOS response-associated peptidase YedK
MPTVAVKGDSREKSGTMCGRFLASKSPDEVARWFATRNATPNARPRYNVAPSQDVLAVRFDAEAGQRTLDALRWGLVPFWAKDIKIGYSLINAKAETVAEKPAFRDAFTARRCLIAADGFYEWKKLDAKARQPYAITMRDRGLFGFAGLWERWKDKAAGGGSAVRQVDLCPLPGLRACRRAVGGGAQGEIAARCLHQAFGAAIPLPIVPT